MISLAIDTATRTAGMAILKDESILVESFFQVAKTASETLLPAIEGVSTRRGSAWTRWISFH